MTAPYNLTFTNSTNPLDIVTNVNTITNGAFGAGICLVIYFIVIKGSTDGGHGIGTSLLASSTILSIISGILLGLQWLPDYVLGINIAVFVAAIFIKVFGEK